MSKGIKEPKTADKLNGLRSRVEALEICMEAILTAIQESEDKRLKDVLKKLDSHIRRLMECVAVNEHGEWWHEQGQGQPFRDHVQEVNNEWWDDQIERET